MAYLLDTSAWLAHLFGESGVEAVNQIFDDPQEEVYVSALSLPEVYGRLSALGQHEQWPVVLKNYQALFSRILSADEQVALLAVQLRSTTPVRLPTIDGLIAATAVAHRLTLIHRDPHLAAIPSADLNQQLLPSK